MSIEALSGKVFLLITGASRGIGRQIAITFGSLLQESSHILLLARNSKDLQEVAKNIHSKVTVDTVSMDLSKSTKADLEEVISQSLKETSWDSFDRVVLVHNVSVMGDITKVANELGDISVWREIYDVNVFIPFILNTVIMNIFGKGANIKKLIINITSLYAIQPSFGWAHYATSKAAREMYFKVLALENPDIDVLNYSPGPVDTEMLHTAIGVTIDPMLKQKIDKMIETKTVIRPEQTVNRLVEVLRKHKYKSADHVDYYDEL